MAKVTVNHETPSESIVKASNQAAILKAGNRSIGVKKLSPLDRLKMFEVIGPENSKNDAYMGYAALAFCVSSIDGDPVMRPGSRLQLEALVQRLDDDGLNAIAEHLSKLASEAEVSTETLKNG